MTVQACFWNANEGLEVSHASTAHAYNFLLQVALSNPVLLLINPQAEQKAAPAAPSRPTRRASLAFMEMLRSAKSPAITVDSAWADVVAQFEADRRFKAVADPEQRLQMFDTFKDALARLEEAKQLKQRAAASDNFKVCVPATETSPMTAHVNISLSEHPTYIASPLCHYWLIAQVPIRRHTEH